MPFDLRQSHRASGDRTDERMTEPGSGAAQFSVAQDAGRSLRSGGPNIQRREMVWFDRTRSACTTSPTDRRCGPTRRETAPGLVGSRGRRLLNSATPRRPSPPLPDRGRRHGCARPVPPTPTGTMRGPSSRPRAEWVSSRRRERPLPRIDGGHERQRLTARQVAPVAPPSLPTADGLPMTSTCRDAGTCTRGASVGEWHLEGLTRRRHRRPMEPARGQLLYVREPTVPRRGSCRCA